MRKTDLKAKAAKKATEPAEPAPPPAPEPDPAAPFEGEPEYAPAEPRERLFEDLDDDEGIVQMQMVPVRAERPADGLPALDSDLTEDQKAEFVALLNSFMPLRRRAQLLALLCTKTDTKRAPVALRAIQEVNSITKITGTTAATAPPLFQLPPGTSVSIAVQKVKK